MSSLTLTETELNQTARTLKFAGGQGPRFLHPLPQCVAKPPPSWLVRHAPATSFLMFVAVHPTGHDFAVRADKNESRDGPDTKRAGDRAVAFHRPGRPGSTAALRFS